VGKHSSPGTSVFEALGFRADEAQHLLTRAQLVAALQERLRKSGVTQAAMARQLGIRQQRVSNLLAGRIDLFSTGALIDLLARLGIGLEIRLRPLPKRPAA
jgi:predicted XRE-type DNA-binding protein